MGGESADGEGKGRGGGDKPGEVYLMRRMSTILWRYIEFMGRDE
jgi:hypothetical protein